MLRVVGESLDIEKLLQEVLIEPDQTWKKGDRRFKSDSNSRLLTKSGVFFVASDADMDNFKLQQEETFKFLEKNILQIVKITEFLGVEEVTIDFGVELRDVAIHCDYLTPKFLGIVAKAGIGIEISHYPCIEEQ